MRYQLCKTQYENIFVFWILFRYYLHNLELSAYWKDISVVDIVRHSSHLMHSERQENDFKKWQNNTILLITELPDYNEHSTDG